MENLNMSTHEVYCSLDICKLLKEAGFDWNTLTYYPIDDEVLNERALVGSNVAFNHNRDDSAYSAPTIDVTQRWLRKVKNIFVEVTRYETINPLARELFEAVYDKTVDQSFAYGVNVLDANNESIYDEDCFLTYEEAQEAGIKKVLEIILEKGE